MFVSFNCILFLNLFYLWLGNKTRIKFVTNSFIVYHLFYDKFPFLFFFSPNRDNRDERIGSSNGTRSCRFSWLKIILMALWNWTPSVAAVCKKRAKGKPPSKSDRVKITGSAFRQNNSTIWLRSWIFINFSLFDKGEKSLNHEFQHVTKILV